MPPDHVGAFTSEGGSIMKAIVAHPGGSWLRTYCREERSLIDVQYERRLGLVELVVSP